MDAKHYPVSARSGLGKKRTNSDEVTSKLAALQFYQLAIPAPEPPKNSFNADAAKRGMVVFNERPGVRAATFLLYLRNLDGVPTKALKYAWTIFRPIVHRIRPTLHKA
jgi:hypothetical protein